VLTCGRDSGRPEKVLETKAKFPKALYCGTDEVVEVLAEVVG
jgi:hypothetical protein